MTNKILILLLWFAPLIGALQAQPLYTPPALGLIPSEQYFGEPVTHEVRAMDEGAKFTVRITAMRGVQLVMDTVVVVTHGRPFKFQLVEGFVSWKVLSGDDSGLKRLPKLLDPEYQVTIHDITGLSVRPYSPLTLSIYSSPKA